MTAAHATLKLQTHNEGDTLRINYSHKGAVDMAQKLFRDEPTLSVLDAARKLKTAGMGLAVPVIARVRRDVRVAPPPPPTLESVLGGAQLCLVKEEAKPQPAPPQAAPPEAAAEEPPPMPKHKREKPAAAQPLPVLRVPPEELDVGRMRHGRGAAMRKKWLSNMVEQSPGFTGAAYQQALLETFGHGVDPTYLYEVLRIAREIREAPQAEALQPPPPTPPKPAPAPMPPQPQPLPAADFEGALRAMGEALRNVCQQHGVSSARLTWDGQRLQMSAERRVSSSLEL